MRLSDLASRLGCGLEGDGALEVTRVAALDAAGPGDLSFFVNPRYAAALARTRATAVIAGEGAPAAPCAVLRAEAPYVAFARALEILQPRERPAPGLDPTAVVSPEAVVGEDVAIGACVTIAAGAVVGPRSILHPHVTIGPRAVIGEACELHAHVSIREDVVLGARVVVQDGAVVGSDGFGFATDAGGVHHKIPQVGRVVVEDDVEIGANSTVDRPPVGETRIGAGTKIDNLVQVAHGVQIGRRVLLAAQVGIAGSSTLEDGVVLAGQVGVAGHITLGKGVVATAQTGIPNSVPAGSLISGYPAVDNREWLKTSAVVRKLPEMRKALAQLEKRVAALEREAGGSEDPSA
ncbi:MAG: UDP-3-O-(3-hydroxymyristoyl)glucosamine N-acyltransferase [Vicinamibacteraceae bacterium]|nr:UDP-3-O-(3-hydroxymyristoyl)glucosamine N-acyltransferase [Vicinamibacteraceae bacterium]